VILYVIVAKGDQLGYVKSSDERVMDRDWSCRRR